MNLPWKETLIILLLVALSMALSDLHLKNKYVRDIAMHPLFRFSILFLTSFLIFSFNIDGNYSLATKVVVSSLVAIFVMYVLSANTTMLDLVPESES